MKKSKNTFIGLLRGINVTGRNMIPMADLRALCIKLGWGDVQTYIQSGNLVFTSDKTAAALEAELEKAIEKRFKLSIPVIVRAAKDWPDLMKGNPFLDVCENAPNHVMMLLSKAPSKPDALASLRERAINGERLHQTTGALWIHFAKGVAGSKVSPALLDRLVGSPVTARNWRTVLKLDEMTKAIG